MCKSLAGGTWLPVTVSLPSDIAPSGYVLGINKYSTQADVKNLAEKSRTGRLTSGDSDIMLLEDLPNIHGDRAFIAKIQASLPWSPGEPSIQIYDRRRSFTVFVMKDVDPTAFGAIFDLCRRDGYIGSKVYRWMKRTGDKSFSVCLDREPTGDIKW